MVEKTTLLDIWMTHYFDIDALALTANVETSTVDAMLNSQPVPVADAEKVLARLSALLQQDLRLETVHVVLKKSRVNNSEVARIMQDIDAEYQAARHAMQGFMQGASQHDFITKRTENMANYFKTLGEKMGDDAVIQAMIEWKDKEASTHKEIMP